MKVAIKDNVDSGTPAGRFTVRDGGVSGASDTADGGGVLQNRFERSTVLPNANGDLVDENGVANPNLGSDLNTQQHMTTFYRRSGYCLMTHRSDLYYSVAEGDFYKIKTASSGCSWTSGVCNWPFAGT